MPIHSVGSFFKGLGNFMMHVSNDDRIHPEDHERTVFIDDLGVSSVDFAVPHEVIERLVDSGRQATRRFLGLS